MHKHKYVVKWLLTDGVEVVEKYDADLYQVAPNGQVIFFVLPKVTQINFTHTPEGGPQPEAEIVGTVAGFNMIRREG
jgi:hypothetical protein